jgi:acyl dehydratase
VTTTIAPKVLLGDVKVGDELPTLTYEVTATTVVLGAIAARDYRPMHHDYDFAVNRNGEKNIFLNTPNQAAWYERYVTDWTGPHGRLARLTFRMRHPVFPDDTMVMRGTVTAVGTDDTGCGFVELNITMKVGDTDNSDCDVRVAIPISPDDNPWARSGDQWKP